MGFRKFGTSDDQRVLADEKDDQGVRKESRQKWSDKDRSDLMREVNDEDDRWESEGGNGTSRK